MCQTTHLFFSSALIKKGFVTEKEFQELIDKQEQQFFE
jgi:hypothetical protein